MGYFDSYSINLITVVFLLISACNYTLHYAAWATGGVHPKYYWKDPEFRAFVVIQFLLFGICFLMLLQHHTYDSYYDAFDQAIFQTVSISTTAGFTTTGFSEWPLLSTSKFSARLRICSSRLLTCPNYLNLIFRNNISMPSRPLLLTTS